ncbi:hypothetical protein IW140_003423 [Coemansia sp. RSA 1813]|nr:protein that induces appearance of [PIN+] prion when overproduced [Coemansia sp. RSA 1646]KAJ1767880.1 hypothetical protein LPJ74_005127 [Coemansia sp. RSA 1843]KAJ2089287.1 hypothetical protein IW138_003607 [Coemansia sp. RSA 986]KAJ2215116.1 hypothetical protein EV179_002484 [Coemansia sp. RSA 487]KAJ2569058.1 hypothetical protein IW140_003423 [Coemansia sp. RSA 1813]
MLVYPQTSQPGPLPKYSLHEPIALGIKPLVAYLCGSIRRDVRLLTAMGCISEQGAKVIASYLPHADDPSDDAMVRALEAHVAHDGPLSPASAVAVLSQSMGSLPKDTGDERRPIAQAKKLNRQRSETAPLRPVQTHKQQAHVRESGSPRKEKQRHEGLGARLGAFFNKLTLDSETSPRSRGTKGSLTPAIGKVPFPQSPGALSFVHSESALVSPADDGRRAHERSLSDTPQPAGHAPRLPHRVTVSHCQSPTRDTQRKSSHGSRRSGASSGQASSEASTLASGRTTAASNRLSNRASGASTLANRKRSFTHLGLSMEMLPADAALRPLSSGASGPQLRRAKPAANISALQTKLGSPGAVTEGMARLAAPSNSLGLVLQSSSAALAATKPKPLAVSIRAQRHHSSLSTVKEPRSPMSARIHCGLTSIVQSRAAAPCKSAAPSTLAFPPMPSDACQAAMLSAATPLSPPHDADRRAKPTPPPIARALSDSTSDAALASMALVATAAYDYASGIKGDLEFLRGERIVIQSKVNDDWWFGSILPDAGRGSTGRSGMFPRSHVAL